MSDYYFFEDDVLTQKTFLKWEGLSLVELAGERDEIMRKLSGAWGNNHEVKKRLIKLLDKFEDYYEHRLQKYRQDKKNANTI